jgi:hypothetical protein
MGEIVINGLSGITGYYTVVICNSFLEDCQILTMANTGDPLPLVVSVPLAFSAAPQFAIVILDSKSCQTIKTIYCDTEKTFLDCDLTFTII